MRFLWAFNHDESTRSFAEAAPGSGLRGLLLGRGTHRRAELQPAGDGGTRARVAWEALHQAQANAPHASAVEQALIEALATRYTSAKPLTPAQNEAVAADYAAAMRTVARRFPDDLDVQVLCAAAQMNVHAWKLWDAQGNPTAGTLEIQARLEAVLKRDPKHPGANHYYIHVMEASPDPGKAVAAAERVRGMMPAAGHLEHMPAHIMQRVGRYEEAAEASRIGAAADRAYFASTAAPGLLHDVPGAQLLLPRLLSGDGGAQGGDPGRRAGRERRGAGGDAAGDGGFGVESHAAVRRPGALRVVGRDDRP
jgi:hypothetical protein